MVERSGQQNAVRFIVLTAGVACFAAVLSWGHNRLVSGLLIAWAAFGLLLMGSPWGRRQL